MGVLTRARRNGTGGDVFILYCVFSMALKQPRETGCLIPGSVQDWVGYAPEQPGLVEVVCSYGEGIRRR